MMGATTAIVQLPPPQISVGALRVLVGDVVLFCHGFTQPTPTIYGKDNWSSAPLGIKKLVLLQTSKIGNKS